MNTPTHCDFLVVGSGAAGLAGAVTAAHLGLKTVVLEKENVLGGTTAWSGGWLWIPRNPLARRAGIEEEAAEPLRYLQSLIGPEADSPAIRHFLETGPAMLEFFEQHTAVQFIDGNRIPDFHPVPGAAGGGRSVCAAAYDGRRLGDWLYKLRPPLDVISLRGMGIASGQDMKHFFSATRSLPSALYVLKRLGRHAFDLLRYRRSTQLVNGNALVARLLRSALDKNVAIHTGTRVTALLTDQGRVVGVVAEQDGRQQTLLARKGVLLAGGGFPHDPRRQQQLFKPWQGRQHHSAAPGTNTGDNLYLAEKAGGTITSFEQPGAWSPVSRVPAPQGGYSHFPHLIERAKPGIIAVTPDGKRFVSEADAYHDFIKALFATTPAGQEPVCWLIADHRAQRRWGLGAARPFPFPLGPYLRSGYLKRGATLAELATACDLPAATLEATVARFNTDARTGTDTEFRRGESPYNRVQGDPDHAPNPSLAPLTRGPFYAVQVVVGSLGTFAGISANAQAQVLNNKQQPIPGLFVAGNDMASIFRGHYPSGGITLGPAMTFGYVAAHTAAGAAAVDDPGPPDQAGPTD
ncbi:MAG: FAD-dependent oxidoreductase [Thiothrix sp.]|nr:FAD-dependent oxidoreductase [Thiothrix sp.]HPQ94870.1 FAD-dependent oxidoreductase [Thiolinea sp.]